MEQSYCKKCKFRNGCTCKVYAGRSIYDIKVCPLTTRYYMNLDHMSQFVLDHNPKLFTRWVSKQLPLKINDSVITLRNDFGGVSGKKLTVTGYDTESKCWVLTDDNEVEYFATAAYWYLGLIKELDPEKELEEALDELSLLEELVADFNVDKYSDSVYSSFRKEICYCCRNNCDCGQTKYDIYQCKHFENYFEI